MSFTILLVLIASSISFLYCSREGILQVNRLLVRDKLERFLLGLSTNKIPSHFPIKLPTIPWCWKSHCVSCRIRYNKSIFPTVNDNPVFFKFAYSPFRAWFVIALSEGYQIDIKTIIQWRILYCASFIIAMNGHNPNWLTCKNTFFTIHDIIIWWNSNLPWFFSTFKFTVSSIFSLFLTAYTYPKY